MPGDSDSGPTTIPPTAIRTTSATIVSRTTSTVATIVFFRMTSSSHSRYRMTAMPAATGIPMPNMMKNAKNSTSLSVLVSPSLSPKVVAIVARNSTSAASPTKAIQRICWRSSPRAARYRSTSETTASTLSAMALDAHDEEQGFEDRRDRLDARRVRRIDAVGDVDACPPGASTRRSRSRTATTSVLGSHRHRGDGTVPVGNRARNSGTGATATRKIQLFSQTATWPNGSPPGDVKSAYVAYSSAPAASRKENPVVISSQPRGLCGKREATKAPTVTYPSIIRIAITMKYASEVSAWFRRAQGQRGPEQDDRETEDHPGEPTHAGAHVAVPCVGTEPVTVVPSPGALANANVPADRVEPVGHPLESGPVLDLVGVEPDPVVGDRERQGPVRLGQRDGRGRRPRVLRHVVQRLEAGEVHGRLHLAGYRSTPSLRTEVGTADLVACASSAAASPRSASSCG